MARLCAIKTIGAVPGIGASDLQSYATSKYGFRGTMIAVETKTNYLSRLTTRTASIENITAEVLPSNYIKGIQQSQQLTLVSKNKRAHV